MKLVALKASSSDEARTPITPDAVKRYCKAGFTVCVQKDSGAKAHISDQDYKDAGAKIAATPAAALKGADIVLCVEPPKSKLPKGVAIIGALNPYDEAARKQLASDGVDSFALELLPRISRAQNMDILSSQSNLAGYRAVLLATEHFDRAFPMMMTAAGTVPPAKVFVMGVGVAGLQAIATAKRLGGVVSATDIRPAVKEQVESLGGKFVMVEAGEEAAETKGGYAKEMSKDFQKRQAELIAKTIAKQDIVITTALIPGRAAPTLVTKTMVETMPAGSIIVDLAAARGGNCELTQADKVVTTKNGVTILGPTNLPSLMARDSSKLLAQNIYNFVSFITKTDDKGKPSFAFDEADEIIKGTLLTRGGVVVHERFTQAKAKTKTKLKAKTKAKTKATKTKTTAKAKKPAAKKTKKKAKAA